MKTCHICNKTKPLSEFHIDRSRKDSHTPACKICRNATMKKYYQTEKGKKARKRYQKTEKGKEAQKRSHLKYEKTEKGKAAIHKARKHFYARHPNREKAKRAVNNAIQAGKLPRANTLQCYYCPAQADQYHHWRGYELEHWLNVVPVCVKCHTKTRLAS